MFTTKTDPTLDAESISQCSHTANATSSVGSLESLKSMEEMENEKTKSQVNNIPEFVQAEGSPAIIEINTEPENDLNKSQTELKMESIKRDLDKIFRHSIGEKRKTKKDIEGVPVVKAKKILITGELTGDRDAHKINLRGITKTAKDVKEVKEKCRSAVEKLALGF